MDNSSFGGLPPEIRNYIYKLAMGSNLTILIRSSENSYKLVGRAQNSTTICIAPLAQTCKQIHQESATLFYASNRFHFRSIGILKSFTKVIGKENARSIRDPIVQRFAETGFNLPVHEPAKPNKISRHRLRNAYKLAKGHNWKSLKVYPVFKCHDSHLGLYHRPEIDIMNPEEDWSEWKLDLSRHQANADFLPPFYGLLKHEFDILFMEHCAKFDEQVKNEMKAWQGFLKRLRQK